jgi:hypothetical protein
MSEGQNANRPLAGRTGLVTGSVAKIAGEIEAHGCKPC